MKTRRIAALVLAALMSQMVPVAASAQAEDAVTTQARARFREGVDFYDKGKYEEARLSFLQAYALKKHPAVLLNLAQSSLKAGHALESARYFQQFLRESPTATPQQRKDAESGVAEARQKLGQITIVAPAGAEIALDEQGKVGTAPFNEPVDVEPGPHTLKSQSETVRVVATAGQKVEARFGATAPVSAPTIAPLPTAATTAPAASEPAATPTPPPPERDGVAKRTNLLTPPETMLPVYIGLGAAGVGAIGAIVFAVFKGDAQSKADTVAGEISRAAAQRGLPSRGACNITTPDVQAAFANACQTLRDNNDKVDTNATIANVSLVVMGVGLLTAGGWYLFGPKRDDSKPAASTTPLKRAIVTPYAGYGSGGFTMSGTF